MGNLSEKKEQGKPEFCYNFPYKVAIYFFVGILSLNTFGWY